MSNAKAMTFSAWERAIREDKTPLHDDAIGWQSQRAIAEFSMQNPRSNGECLVLKCVPVTARVPFGKADSAATNGGMASKFASGNVAGEEDTRRVTQILSVWCHLKMRHIQSNTRNHETLLAAEQKTSSRQPKKRCDA